MLRGSGDIFFLYFLLLKLEHPFPILITEIQVKKYKIK